MSNYVSPLAIYQQHTKINNKFIAPIPYQRRLALNIFVYL